MRVAMESGRLRMEYISTAEAARRWGVTPRLVQSYCAQGRIAGAERFGRLWRIPKAASRPRDLRRAHPDVQVDVDANHLTAGSGAMSAPNLMPLMNTAFSPGCARAAAESFAKGPQRDIALAELAYFRGEAARADELAGPYLACEKLDARLSACLICAYANLSLGRIDRARAALEGARGALIQASQANPRLRAAEAFVAQTASVLLHLPPPTTRPMQER